MKFTVEPIDALPQKDKNGKIVFILYIEVNGIRVAEYPFNSILERESQKIKITEFWINKIQTDTKS